MKTVGLVARPGFKAGVKEAGRLLIFLEEEGLTVRLPPHLAKALNRTELGCALKDMHVDFVVTLGGDGTTLFAARTLPSDVPLVPVNLHSFGFLAECEISEAESLLKKVLAGDYSVQKLSRLSIRSGDKRQPDATNEIALFPEVIGRPSSFKVQISKNPWLQFRGDGLLVATPTGSTGHALSLGGPILHPNIDAMLIIAAAPLRHSLLPLVVPGSKAIKVHVEAPARLVIDGEQVDQLAADVQVTIRKSKSPLLVFRRSDSFYNRLKEKLFRCL